MNTEALNEIHAEIERASGRTVRYRSEDYLDCYRVLLALIGLAAPAAYQYPRP